MTWIVFAAAGILVFLSLWVVIPAPTRVLLLLGVSAPEISPLLLVAALVTAVLAWRGAGPIQKVALALALMAGVLFTLPLAQYPRGVPFSVRSLVLGIDTGESRITRGIQFGSPEGVPLTVDIYQPASSGRFPTVVQIYGGAWQRGVPGDDAVFAKRLASRGYVVFAIDYRHAPAWQWPAQRDDVRAALAWIRLHPQAYEANAAKLVIVARANSGTSAATRDFICSGSPSGSRGPPSTS